MLVSPGEIALLVLKYLEENRCVSAAQAFKREAQVNFTLLNASSSVLSSLSDSLQHYVELKRADDKRRQLCSSHPLLRQLVSLIDTYNIEQDVTYHDQLTSQQKYGTKNLRKRARKGNDSQTKVTDLSNEDDASQKLPHGGGSAQCVCCPEQDDAQSTKRTAAGKHSACPITARLDFDATNRDTPGAQQTEVQEQEKQHKNNCQSACKDLDMASCSNSNVARPGHFSLLNCIPQFRPALETLTEDSPQRPSAQKKEKSSSTLPCIDTEVPARPTATPLHHSCTQVILDNLRTVHNMSPIPLPAGHRLSLGAAIQPESERLCENSPPSKPAHITPRRTNQRLPFARCLEPQVEVLTADSPPRVDSAHYSQGPKTHQLIQHNGEARNSAVGSTAKDVKLAGLRQPTTDAGVWPGLTENSIGLGDASLQAWCISKIMPDSVDEDPRAPSICQPSDTPADHKNPRLSETAHVNLCQFKNPVLQGLVRMESAGEAVTLASKAQDGSHIRAAPQLGTTSRLAEARGMLDAILDSIGANKENRVVTLPTSSAASPLLVPQIGAMQSQPQLGLGTDRRSDEWTGDATGQEVLDEEELDDFLASIEY